jgi:chromosome segregation ATPase
MPVQVFPAGVVPRTDRAMSPSPTVPARDLELERSRRAAEDRADAAEGNLRGIQKQLKEALARTAELERRLVTAESTTHTSDSESSALRERLSDTTERLNAAELDAKAQRQRLALKQQELEEAQGRLVSVQTDAGLVEELRRKLAGAESRADGIQALQAKLEAAESRAEEMASEMARMEADLDYAADQFHMTKLSEALRDIDHDGNDEGTQSPLEHPVIIRGGGTGRKVR